MYLSKKKNYLSLWLQNLSFVGGLKTLHVLEDPCPTARLLAGQEDGAAAGEAPIF